MALASVAVPWLFYPYAGGDVADALGPAALFDALWPVLIGAALALALRHWGDRLPLVPAGVIVGGLETGVRNRYVIGTGLERADGQLRQWPAAGLSLLAIAVALGAATLFGH